MNDIDQEELEAWEEFTESDDCHSTGVSVQDAFYAGWCAALDIFQPMEEYKERAAHIGWMSHL